MSNLFYKNLYTLFINKTNKIKKNKIFYLCIKNYYYLRTKQANFFIQKPYNFIKYYIYSNFFINIFKNNLSFK